MEESIKDMIDRIYRRLGIPDHIPDEQINKYKKIRKEKNIENDY